MDLLVVIDFHVDSIAKRELLTIYGFCLFAQAQSTLADLSGFGPIRPGSDQKAVEPHGPKRAPRQAPQLAAQQSHTMTGPKRLISGCGWPARRPAGHRPIRHRAIAAGGHQEHDAGDHHQPVKRVESVP